MLKTFGIKNCCGCEACGQTCSHGAISMQTNLEGFLYPIVDSQKCVGCRKCVKICPALKPFDETQPLRTYAAINEDESMRLKSSSGGLFTMLASEIIEKGGGVFGARFDNDWNVYHSCAFSMEECAKFRGSKYVQSRIGDVYKKVQSLLDEDRFVLFSGTPCQVAGLLHYIKKDYKKLYTVDFICHGVPSPGVWQWYLKKSISAVRRTMGGVPFCSFLKSKPTIVGCDFRNKEFGWGEFRFVLKFAGALAEGEKSSVLSCIHRKNPYMKLFLENVILRPSCYSCPTKKGRSHSDVTLADFWNVHQVIPEWNDDKGVSLLLVNTVKGLELFEHVDCKKKEVLFDDALQYNKAWSVSYAPSPYRESFFSEYRKGRIDLSNYVDGLPVSFFQKVKNSISYRYSLLKSFVF